MDTNRFSQVKKVFQKKNLREEIDLEAINKRILEKFPEDILKKYIFEYMEKNNFSESDLKNLQYKIMLISWEKPDKKISLIQYLYKILSEKILLPDYLKNTQEEEFFEEIDKIIKTADNKINKEIENRENSFFYITYSDFSAILEDYERYWDLPYYSFDLWWIFWEIEFSSEERNIFNIRIPVRIPEKKVKNIRSNEKDDNIDKNILNIALNEIFHWEWNHRSLRNNPWILVDISEYSDKNLDYWETKDLYKMIDIFHINWNRPKDYELKEIIDSMFEALNIIINKIWEKSPVKQSKKIFNYNSFIPLIWEEEWEKDYFWLEKWDIEKFEKKYKIKLSEKINLENIWWQENAKEEIKKIINGIKFENIMKSWGAKSTSWIIFEGPSGTWKTLLAKVIASEVNAETYNVKLTDIASSAYINEWSNNIKDLFSFIKYKSQNSQKKIIVILDELDALFWKRNNWGSNEDTKIVNTFLTEMSWLEKLENVILIWTTNLLENMDDAVIRSWRFSTKVKVDLPDEKWIEEIFNIYIKNAKKNSIKFKKLLNLDSLEKIVKESKWLSGADIEEVLRIVLENKALQEINWEEITEVSENDFLQAIKKVKKPQKRSIWF